MPILAAWLATTFVGFETLNSLAVYHVWEVRWVAAVLVLAVGYAAVLSTAARWRTLSRAARVRLMACWGLAVAHAAGFAWFGV